MLYSYQGKQAEIVLSDRDRDKILDRASEIKSKLIVDVPLTLPIIKIKTLLLPIPNAYAATNGRVLYINPHMWGPLPNNQCEGVFYHEWLHIGLLHPKRMRNRIHRVWNFACDFFINFHIKTDMLQLKMDLAPGMLFDTYYDHNWFAERIYEDLLKEVNERKNKAKETMTDGAIQNIIPNFGLPQPSDPSASGGPSKPASSNGRNNSEYCNREQAIRVLAFEEFMGDVMANDLMLPPLDGDMQDKELIREIIKAAEFHKKSKGKLPGFYEKQVLKLRRARVPWERVFHDIFMELITGSDDRSFARPKRWAMPFGLFLPSETGFQKQEVTLIVDVSGSMFCEKIFGRFIAEVKKILPFVSKLTLIGADAAVHEKVNIDHIHDLIGPTRKFHFRGGGGTDFRPALAAAAKTRADIVIYYTDGYGTYGNCPPGLHRLLWVLTESECPKPPFGKYLIAED